MLEMIANATTALHNNYILMIGAGVFLVTYLFKNVEKIDNRLLPIIAVTTGVVIGIFATWTTGNSIAIGVYDGFLAGLIAAGGKDLIKIVAAILSGKIKDWDNIEDLLDDGQLNESNKKKDK